MLVLCNRIILTVYHTRSRSHWMPTDLRYGRDSTFPVCTATGLPWEMGKGLEQSNLISFARGT